MPLYEKFESEKFFWGGGDLNAFFQKIKTKKVKSKNSQDND